MRTLILVLGCACLLCPAAFAAGLDTVVEAVTTSATRSSREGVAEKEGAGVVKEKKNARVYVLPPVRKVTSLPVDGASGHVAGHDHGRRLSYTCIASGSVPGRSGAQTLARTVNCPTGGKYSGCQGRCAHLTSQCTAPESWTVATAESLYNKCHTDKTAASDCSKDDVFCRATPPKCTMAAHTGYANTHANTAIGTAKTFSCATGYVGCGEKRGGVEWGGRARTRLGGVRARGEGGHECFETPNGV